MTSSIEWLWWHHPREENFLSEAISLATRIDSQPMIRVLQRASLLPADFPAASIDAATQYYVGTVAHGEGAVDIRLLVQSVDQVLEFWVEAKVDAPISGAQLFRYLNAAHHRPLRSRPRLFLLGGDTNPCARPYLPWVPWQWVHDAIEAHSHEFWREIRAYLVEEELARGQRDGHDS